jgi:DNA-binding response OmpR family regulator
MPKQALFISNDTSIAQLVPDLLAKIEIETTMANSIQQADFTLYYRPVPHCIILDLSLTESQPLDHLRTLKAKAGYTQVPCLVLIETLNFEIIKAALQYGVNRYLTKSFLQRNLLKTVMDIMPSPVKG